MLVVIAKQMIDGRWAEIDGSKLFTIGQVYKFGEEWWIVTNIVGSRITFEKDGSEHVE